MKAIKIFKHVTDGGATYLTDNHKFANADIIIRIDGGAELIRCNTDTKAFDEEPKEVVREQDDFEIHNCSKCSKVMTEGYVFGGGDKYFCSDECLHTEVTQEVWEELSAGEDNDAYYWTQWEEESEEIGVELELEIDKPREIEPSTEIELFILFGLDAAILFDDGEITEEVQNNVRRRVFATEGEKNAYIEGMKDNAGWGDYNIISREEYIKVTTTEVVKP